MRFHHPMVVAALLLTATLLSCKRPAAEQYPEKTSLALSEASRMLLHSDIRGARTLLQEHNRFQGTLLLELLTSAEQEQELLHQANQCLQQNQYHTLNELLSQAEKNGQTTPELLRYRSIPQALQALQLFCQRMPWESSEDLQNALDWLQPYAPALEKSPAFQRFWSQQQNLLAPLRQRELQRRCAQISNEMDIALRQGQTPAAWAAGARLQALNPQHPLFLFLDWPGKTLHAQLPLLPPSSPELQEGCELAFALCWEQLPAAQQKRLLSALAALPPESFRTISGLTLLARHHNRPEWLALTFQRWQAQASPNEPLPLFFRDYVLSLLPRPKQAAASCRQYTCPGFTDFFTAFNVLLSPINTQNPRKLP
jgi:hypothetical protein